MNKRLSFEKYCSTVGLSTQTYYIGTSWGYEFPETANGWYAWCAAYDMQQAEIDRLMLELQAQGLLAHYSEQFCPNEMSSMQLATWAKSQKRAPEEFQEEPLYKKMAKQYVKDQKK